MGNQAKSLRITSESSRSRIAGGGGGGGRGERGGGLINGE